MRFASFPSIHNTSHLSGLPSTLSRARFLLGAGLAILLYALILSLKFRPAVEQAIVPLESCLVRQLSGPTISVAAFSPGLDTFVSSAPGGQLTFRDIETGEILPAAATPEPVFLTAVSRNGTSLAVGSRHGTVYFWDLASRRITNRINVTAAMTCLAYSADGSILAVGHSTGTIALWDIHARKRKISLKYGHSPVNSIWFFNRDRTLAAASLDQPLKVWDLAAERCGRVVPDSTASTMIQSARDNKLVAVCNYDGGVRVWEAGTWRRVNCLSQAQLPRLYRTAFTPDGRLLAAAASDGDVILWNTSNWRQVACLYGETSASFIRLLAFSEDGASLIIAWADGTIQIYDVSRFDPPRSWR